MVLNSHSFKEVAHVLASHADVPHVVAKVRAGNGDGMLIFSIPG